MTQNLWGSTGHKSRFECISISECNATRREKIPSGMFWGYTPMLSLVNLPFKGNSGNGVLLSVFSITLFLLSGFNSSLTFTPFFCFSRLPFTPQCWEIENKLDNSCKAPLRQNFCSGSCNKKHEQCRGFSHTCSRPWSNSGKFYQLPEQYCTVQDSHYKRISSIPKALHKSPFCCSTGQICRTWPWTLVPKLSVQLPDSHIHEYPFENRLQQQSFTMMAKVT